MKYYLFLVEYFVLYMGFCDLVDVCGYCFFYNIEESDYGVVNWM